ncbi:hypothetical protein L6452_13561 [Arctium lappa]|uniref:Uncharacterized protein n=1 Tax=Arctium lappa TaxID=4217 RepID=A0ACB9CIH4_ARCLA|nr:hypothetical protein L6452_13561 [Arctium lappa]
MQFYNMFDISGPTLGTVNASVNKLTNKVDSLSSSINTTTSAGRFGSLTAEVRGLSSKINSCTTLLNQVLTKLNEPTPTPTPSFTENDRTSLNISVEFIHQATSDIPDIEGRLERLEAKVRSKPVAEAITNVAELPRDDNDKEGERSHEENSDATATKVQVTEEPPSQVEGEKVAEVSATEDQAPPFFSLAMVDEEEEEEEEEKENDEELDLSDQGNKDVADNNDDDDDDDEDDRSLWFSATNVSSVPTMKGIVISEARGEGKQLQVPHPKASRRE